MRRNLRVAECSSGALVYHKYMHDLPAGSRQITRLSHDEQVRFNVHMYVPSDPPSSLPIVGLSACLCMLHCQSQVSLM
jgi:hypothetical protein